MVRTESLAIATAGFHSTPSEYTTAITGTVVSTTITGTVT